MELFIVSGCGNTFAALDGFDGGIPPEPAELARRVCAAGPPVPPDDGGQAAATPRSCKGPPGGALDGLLIIAPAGEGLRLLVYNADGSRPEACGNGLRCAALLARRQRRVVGDAMTVETDAGPREVLLLRRDGRVRAARAGMGQVRFLARELSLEGVGLAAALVEVGNPHCVVLVPDPATAPVEELGAVLERHPRMPGGGNVEFACVREGRVHARVWERGVGETAACGTGACAVATVIRDRGLEVEPIEVVFPGGTLTVSWSPKGEALLTGPCAVHSRFTWPASAGAEV